MSKSIQFYNNTDFPIMVDSWINNSLYCLKIESQEKCIIYSDDSEWFLNSMFDLYDDRQLWRNNNLKKYVNIGKFRSVPDISNIYSWINYENKFECLYSEKQINNNMEKIITFSLK